LPRTLLFGAIVEIVAVTAAQPAALAGFGPGTLRAAAGVHRAA